MTSVPIEFLDEALQYIDNEVIGNSDTEDRYFDKCKVRRFDRTMLEIRNLSHIKRNGEKNLVFVNNRLSKGSIVYCFHCDSNSSAWTSWEGLLTSFTARLNVGLTPPYVLKWESTGMNGRLKADERHDGHTYIEKDIPAKEALSISTRKLLHEYLPRDEDHYEMEEIKPQKIKALFEENTEKIAKL